MVVTGDTEEEVKAATQAVKAQLAFYGSTPAYRPVLDHHGWGDLQTELNTLSKRGEWDDRWPSLIDDEMVRDIRSSRRTRRDPGSRAFEVRRRGRPVQLLRAVQGRSRALAAVSSQASLLARGTSHVDPLREV